VTPVEHLAPLDPRYPSRLRALHKPPLLSARGGSLESSCVVGIVGSRNAHDAARGYATNLARELVQAGAVVVSGGALGIDAAAHRGALDAGGRTWLIAGSGCMHCFPPQHDSLYDSIGNGPGAVLWPFTPERAPSPSAFRARNKVLACLADAVVVVQAGERSGALHAAGCVRRLGKPLWVVPTPPWLGPEGFEGTHELMQEGSALLLTSTRRFLQSIGASAGAGAGESASKTPSVALSTRTLSADESAAFAALACTGPRPLHLDEIATRAALCAQTARAVLLTLALENVVVEGPPGFFRRRDGL
jgi:DNA processing protein